MTESTSPSELDWAWAAGIFEGEGCLYSRPGRGQATLAVQMCDRDIVERFATIMGCGRMGFQASKNPKHRDLWKWVAGRRDDVLRICDRLYPMMGVRRRAKMDEVLPGLRGARDPIHTLDLNWTCEGRPSLNFFSLGCRCAQCCELKRQLRIKDGEWVGPPSL